jgi:hypothetical protein
MIPGVDTSPRRHVALLEIQGKEFQMTPIPLRTVRPFVLEALVLTEAAEEEGFEVSDQMEVTKFLKTRVRGSRPALCPIDEPSPLQVNALIKKANQLWDERNERAVAEGEKALPPMLPLIRLKARLHFHLLSRRLTLCLRSTPPASPRSRTPSDSGTSSRGGSRTRATSSSSTARGAPPPGAGAGPRARTRRTSRSCRSTTRA